MSAAVAPPITLEPNEANRLALDYRAGRRTCLGELHRLLRPAISRAIHHTLRNYAASASRLPSALDAEDLAQQSWIILAELAQRWRPELGTFSAYVAGSLSWALERYIRQHSPGRRAARIKIVEVGEETLSTLVERQVGEDGRAWADWLACQELLACLPETQRQVFTMRAVERKPLPAVASLLGISKRSARHLFKQAQIALRNERLVPTNQAALEELGRVVKALHEGAVPRGSLPGRAWVCAHTSVSQARYTYYMARLVAVGCIAGRSARRPGRLVEPTPQATMARVASGEWRAGA